MRKIEFNNGFITAIALFLEHKQMESHMVKDKDGKVISDIRLYGATDHLYDLEIPKKLPENLKNRIYRWRKKCFDNRLNNPSDIKIGDSLFKEGEDILRIVDEQIFKTEKVKMNYR
jgi:hypothetical protein